MHFIFFFEEVYVSRRIRQEIIKSIIINMSITIDLQAKDIHIVIGFVYRRFSWKKDTRYKFKKIYKYSM